MPAQLFQEYYARLKTQVDDALQRQLDAQDWPAPLKEAVEYSLMATGKRLRPVLVMMSTEVCSGTGAAALPAACAIEMIHTYSLIHDDLPSMDDDDLRRGRPTSHVVYGEALAILAGDALLTLAFETLAAAPVSAAVTVDCLRSLGTAAGGGGMVGGQVLDLEAERGAFFGVNVSTNNPIGGVFSVDAAQVAVDETGGQVDSSIPSSDENLIRVEQLSQIHKMKTGALISTALQLGAAVAEAPSEQRESLRDYGARIGLAFQIADDLLDVTGNDDKLGKETGRDRELGKLTYPSLIGVEASRQKATALVNGARDALAPFGETADHLVELAQFIVERDH
ncbi:MAG: polyprenyl synthetase family protein [Fuerstiella sp.]|nr:polyprenyl synthetase family protein [Fuerstiella sp.]